MMKQKIMRCHAWKTCTITYNKNVSEPFPLLTMSKANSYSETFFVLFNRTAIQLNKMWKTDFIFHFLKPINQECVLVIDPQACKEIILDVVIVAFFIHGIRCSIPSSEYSHSSNFLISVTSVWVFSLAVKVYSRGNSQIPPQWPENRNIL